MNVSKGACATPGAYLQVFLLGTRFIAGCLTVFILYDISALGILINRFPYEATSWSAGRHALDALMALLLFFLYQTGMRLSDPSVAATNILISVSVWHVLASFWHVLATLEHEGGFPSADAFVWHYVFPVFYWLLLWLWRRLPVTMRPDYGDAAVVAFGLLCVALFRLLQIYDIFRPLSVAAGG